MLLKKFVPSVGKYTILPADVIKLVCYEPWGKVLEFSRKLVCRPIDSQTPLQTTEVLPAVADNLIHIMQLQRSHPLTLETKPALGSYTK